MSISCAAVVQGHNGCSGSHCPPILLAEESRAQLGTQELTRPSPAHFTCTSWLQSRVTHKRMTGDHNERWPFSGPMQAHSHPISERPPPSQSHAWVDFHAPAASLKLCRASPPQLPEQGVVIYGLPSPLRSVLHPLLP